VFASLNLSIGFAPYTLALLMAYARAEFRKSGIYRRRATERALRSPLTAARTAP